MPDSNTNTDDSTTGLPENTDRPFHNCEVAGKVLEDNELWLRDQSLLFCIVADSTTFDKDFGESHRKFQVYNTTNCSLILDELLPVNNSPDFPYYIEKNLHQESPSLVCVQGFDFTFCYDIENKQLLPRMQPTYLTQRTATDAQSGLPMGLEKVGNYLFGYSLEYGAFAFDLSKPAEPKPLLPAAEFTDQTTQSINSLFFIPKGMLEHRGIIPTLNEDENGIELVDVFKRGVQVTTGVAKNVRNNRYIIVESLTSSMGERVVIDMKKKEKADVPRDIAVQQVSKVLDWIKTNRD